jgi:hypothetical protein
MMDKLFLLPTEAASRHGAYFTNPSSGAFYEIVDG